MDYEGLAWTMNSPSFGSSDNVAAREGEGDHEVKRLEHFQNRRENLRATIEQANCGLSVAVRFVAFDVASRPVGLP